MQPVEEWHEKYLMPEGVEDSRDGDHPIIQKNVALLVEKLKKDGHDGIIIRAAEDPEISDTWEELASPNFVVFSPEQIKSVFNRGTWDGNDPRILFQTANRGQSQAEAALERDVAAWEKTVDDFLAGTLKPRRSVTILSQTPLVLSLLGANKDLSVSTDYGKLKKILHDKHKLPENVLKQVAGAMADPVMIFESSTVKGDYVMMLGLKDEKGATVVVPISFNYNGIGGYTVNYVPSVYAKSNIQTGRPNNAWFTSQIESGNLRYINNKKSRAWVKSSGLQLPKVGSHPRNGKNKILTETDLVKLREQYPAHYSRAAGTARGGMRKMANGQYVVGLFRKANASTILHETAHFWLEELREAAGLETAPEWVRDAWGKLQTAYDFEGFLDEENAEGVSVWRGVQERFAREFEAYAREGKAPSWELQSAFNKFRNWLTEIYRTVRKLLGVRGVQKDGTVRTGLRFRSG